MGIAKRLPLLTKTYGPTKSLFLYSRHNWGTFCSNVLAVKRTTYRYRHYTNQDRLNHGDFQGVGPVATEFGEDLDKLWTPVMKKRDKRYQVFTG